jgi:hypothetical protein
VERFREGDRRENYSANERRGFQYDEEVGAIPN